MRNFSKTLISMAAVVAVGSAMAAGAMAADATASYADGVVTLTGSYATGSSQTMIVFKGAETDATIDEENIKQIDQVDNVADGAAAFSKITVGELAEGDYVVRIGGTYDGGVKTETFTVGGAVKPDTIIVADVNNDGNIRVNDVTMIARTAQEKATGNRGNTGVVRTLYSDPTQTVVWGDCNGDKTIRINDVTMAARVAQEKATGNRGNAEVEYEVMPISQ